MTDLWKNALRVADVVDDLPVSPRRLAGRVLDRFHDLREARAALDPRWAEIQERRTLGDGRVVVLSEGVTLADAAVQDTIATELTPDPVWLPLAYRVRDFSVRASLTSAHHTFQRARRGWADSDVWELRSSHERVLGEQLLHLARTAHGWPCNPAFPTFEDWTGALELHGNVLVRHGWTGVPEDELLDRWHALATDPLAARSEEERTAHEALRTAEAAANERVRASLHWVADHNAHLWD